MGITAFLIVASCVFGIVCILQTARILLRWPVKIAAFEVPFYASWIAVALSGYLCFWGFRLILL
jgi:hypothetical protein